VTQAVAVRRDGDAYQARMFWMLAAPMLASDGALLRVGFESGTKGFDDAWAEYDPKRAPLDAFGKPIVVERLQCKWHARPGEYTHKDLTQPEFINATSVSFLQRAHQALAVDRARAIQPTLRLVTNYRPSPNDVLASLIHTRHYSLRTAELYAGKSARSATGAMRTHWANHLGIDEDELRTLCGSLQFFQTRESLDAVRELLNDRFARFGLKPIDLSVSTTEYDAIPFAWAAQGRIEFGRKDFREACGREGLLAHQSPRTISFGIKSFEHPTDRLEARCDLVLNLVPAFNERLIRDAQAWRGELQPRIQTFLRDASSQAPNRVRLTLDTHASLAFAAGAVLDTKSGRLVEIEQRSPNRKVWAPDDEPISPAWPRWRFETVDVDPSAEGIAVSVCITHDVLPDVQEYLLKLGPVRQILVAKLTVAPGQQVIACGAHADQLAQALAAYVKTLRAPSPSRPERIHLFIAGPNGFVLYLGRHVQSLKPVTLYEFDFDSSNHRTYESSLSYPESVTP
jgi:SMODS-associated and fused to various effectors sensor domain